MGDCQLLAIAGSQDLIATHGGDSLHICNPGSDDNLVTREGGHEVFDVMRSDDPARPEFMIGLRAAIPPEQPNERLRRSEASERIRCC